MIRDIRALTFDLDNTLWETDISILNAEAVMASHLRNLAPEAWMADFTLENFRKIRALVVTNHSEISHNFSAVRRKTLALWFQSKGAKVSQSEDLADEGFRAFYRERQNVTPYADAESTLEALARKYPIGAITNGNADVMEMSLGRFFQFSLQAQEFPKAKPHPMMFKEALTRFAIEPHHCLHIGDNLEHDIVGAQAAGMKAAWINTRQHSAAHVVADITIESLRDLLKYL
ncbi:HAD-IA family hydrolase [Litorivicinus sp.]|jgi:HAD superfamily hydrolase (TIGR01549 family)|nr:HAD-IA family hydrolase [Litorivicinus sp.]